MDLLWEATSVISETLKSTIKEQRHSCNLKMEFSTEDQFLLSARVFLQVLQYHKPAREKTPLGHFIQFAKGEYDIHLGQGCKNVTIFLSPKTTP